MYLLPDVEGKQDLELKCKFDRIVLEDSQLRGTVEFDLPDEATDVDGHFTVVKKKQVVEFVIGLKPHHHLVIISASAKARELAKIMSAILFDEDTGHITRVKLTDNQFFKLLAALKHTVKGQISASTLDGISTIAMHGSNVEKPIEHEMIKKYLTEDKALKLYLHEYDWLIWVSKKTGAIACMTSHSTSEFVRFIQKQILSLTI